MTAFEKILIANRGEIAVRIARTCRKMGIRSVAVCSETDLRSVHVKAADESVCIGGTSARESYLDVEKILNAAREKNCGAIHPGYGFLSENPDFARRAVEAGFVFIGPPAEAIALLGDKLAAKELAAKAGAPVVPASARSLGDAADARREVERIGLPVLLKPAAGGGGRGMRIVHRIEELDDALASAREEVRKGFGDDRIYAERFVANPRHIEVQIAADNAGRVIHLGERECSVQRRYQKIIEESPSPAVDEDLRRRLGSVAVAIAKAAGYRNLGTMEFLLSPEREFFFLEMNTRLQVEHTVTEAVTGLDLVEWQIRLAAGEPLPLAQEDVKFRGWAIEARICAEDPSRGFLPTIGMITRYAVPAGGGIRVDSGIDIGSVIPIQYDSLLAKVISHGADREEARRSLVRALNGYHIEGLATNVDFAGAVASHPAFIKGELSTGFIDKHFVDGRSKLEPDRELLHHMAMAAALVYHTRHKLVRESLKPLSSLVGCASDAGAAQEYVIRADKDAIRIRLECDETRRRWSLLLDGKRYEAIAPEFEYYRRRLALKIDGVSCMFRLKYDEEHIKVYYSGLVRTMEIYSPLEWELAGHMLAQDRETQSNVVRCPMPGVVVRVSAQKGGFVRKGQELFTVESMKMESSIASPRDGLVERILVEPGQTLNTEDELLVFKSSE